MKQQKKIIKWKNPNGRTQEELQGWIVVSKKTGTIKGKTIHRTKSAALKVVKKLNKIQSH